MHDILFFTPTDTPVVNEEVGGTLLLATILKNNGFDVDILRIYQLDKTDDYRIFVQQASDAIIERNPKILSFYCIWTNFHQMLGIARAVKQRRPDIIIVLGGPQADAAAAETLAGMPFVDYISTGEGEMVIAPFFGALLEGKSVCDIPGICYRRDGKVILNPQSDTFVQLDTLPYIDYAAWLPLDTVPDYRLALGKSENGMVIDAGRGCPFACTYCCTSVKWRRQFRLKSADRVVEEIRRMKASFGITRFNLAHDSFTANKEKVLEFCEGLIQADLGIQWDCSSRIDTLDESVVDKMIQSGMCGVELGMETGSQRMQALVHKNLNLDNAVLMLHYLVDRGLDVTVFFMYGFPGEERQDLAQTLNMMFDLVEYGVHSVPIAVCLFAPSTKITTDNMDGLYLDPERFAGRKEMGVREEREIIEANPAVFSYFYDFHSDVRDNFRWLSSFVGTCNEFRRPMYYLRRVYGRDDILRLYEDFCRSNEPLLRDPTGAGLQTIKEDKCIIFENICRIALKDHPQANAIGSAFRFDQDMRQLNQSGEDCFELRQYDFDYHAYMNHLPLAQLNGTTRLAFDITNGVMTVKALK